MKNVVIIGASGNIATLVADLLLTNGDVKLTLLVRQKSRLRLTNGASYHVVEGSAMDQNKLKQAIAGQDIVYINLAGDLEAMTQNIVRVMKEEGVGRVIFISSIGIYETPLRPVLKPYRNGADVIESSGLDYTILRPTWFTSVNEVDYETTRKGEPEKGSVISQKSLATLIADIIEQPDKYVRANLGVNKPNS